jgi:RES domain-containing protein
MRVWRLSKAEFARDCLRGEGARLFGGRWNLAGIPVVYSASTLALATLELLVHVDRANAPDDLVAVELDIPPDVSLQSLETLPADWQHYPVPPSTQRAGSLWARERASCVLRVPSVVIPREHNYLINPLHPEADRVSITHIEPFSFDPRLTRAQRH